MTTKLQAFNFDTFPNVGFTRLFDELRSELPTWGNYPPSNLIQYEDQTYMIEVAVAGFTKDELSVKKDGDYLVVSGKSSLTGKDTKGAKYIHRGLAARDFSTKYFLAKYVEVTYVALVNGVLTIQLENRLPEAEKARIFEIL